MLAGAYPSDEFAELKPRVVWDRVTDVVEGRRDARVVAVTSGGTIPDRGLYRRLHGRRGRDARPAGRRARRGDGLRAAGRDARRRRRPRREQLAGRGDRSRPGDRQPGARGPGQAAVLARRRRRPADRARARDRRVRRRARGRPGPRREGPGAPRPPACARRHDLDERAAENLLAYLEDEREATGALPTDRRIVVERFRDELGDWRLCLLTPFGGRVHAPWTLAHRGADRRAPRDGGPDDLVGRRDRDPAARGRRRRSTGSRRSSFPMPDEVEDLVVGQLGDLGALRQPLPRERRPRAPAAAPPARDADAALAAAPAVGGPARRRVALRQLPDPRRDLSRVPVGRVRPAGPARDPGRRSRGARSPSTRSRPSGRRRSPSSLLFDYVAAYMYDGDTPLAERRAGALTLDRDLLRELLGQEELRELLDPEALADLELEPPGADRRPAGDDLDGVHDLLRRLGDLTADEVAARTEGGGGGRRPVAGRAGGCPARGSHADRRGRALGRDRGRRAIPRRGRGRAAGRDPGGVPRAGRRGAGRPARALGADARTVPDAGPGRGAGGCPSGSSRTRSSGWLAAGLAAAWRVPTGRRGT